ncbi:MAG: hypothetical protein COA94_08360 [Rickettsiales bacterium]|nr:MAG: hypothetical protein COA94_08360 [Rickettsiales bacterium]
MEGPGLKDILTGKYGDKAKIGALVEMAMNDKLPYPFIKNTIDPKLKFNNLRKFTPTILESQYKISGHNNQNNLYHNWKGGDLVSDPENSYDDYNIILDYYTEIERSKSSASGSISSFDSWSDRTIVKKVMTEIVKNHKKGGKMPTLRDFSDALYNQVKRPGLFRPTWLKGIFWILYKGKYPKDLNILNMSSGWGSELMISLVLGYSYLGFDPNKKLKPGHDAMIVDFGNVKKQKVIYEPFENYDLGKLKFDIAVTSPPFYDKEIYSSGEQSIDTYSDFSSWMVGFLFQYISNAWYSIKVGGYLIIHMSDIRGREINNPMNLYIEQFLKNSSWVKMVGVSFSKNAGYPVWIWQKKNGALNKWNRKRKRKFSTLYPSLFDKIIMGYVRTLTTEPKKSTILELALADVSPDVVNYARDTVFRENYKVEYIVNHSKNTKTAKETIRKIALFAYYSENT